mgnify:CR=1 FL=1
MFEKPSLMSTPRSTVLEDGPAKLYRFHPTTDVALVDAPPVFLVPSMINRWYVLDLRSGSSFAEGLVRSTSDHGIGQWLAIAEIGPRHLVDLGAAPFADPAAARRALALAILALDPCVPHELELTDA